MSLLERFQLEEKELELLKNRPKVSVKNKNAKSEGPQKSTVSSANEVNQTEATLAPRENQ